MSDKIPTNVIDECSTHTMCVAERFSEGKTKQNKTKRKKWKPKIRNRSGILVSTFDFS